MLDEDAAAAARGAHSSSSTSSGSATSPTVHGAGAVGQPVELLRAPIDISKGSNDGIEGRHAGRERRRARRQGRAGHRRTARPCSSSPTPTSRSASGCSAATGHRHRPRAGRGRGPPRRHAPRARRRRTSPKPRHRADHQRHRQPAPSPPSIPVGKVADDRGGRRRAHARPRRAARWPTPSACRSSPCSSGSRTGSDPAEPADRRRAHLARAGRSRSTFQLGDRRRASSCSASRATSCCSSPSPPASPPGPTAAPPSASPPGSPTTSSLQTPFGLSALTYAIVGLPGRPPAGLGAAGRLVDPGGDRGRGERRRCHPVRRVRHGRSARTSSAGPAPDRRRRRPR